MAEFCHPLTFGVVIAQHQYTWSELISGTAKLSRPN